MFARKDFLRGARGADHTLNVRSTAHRMVRTAKRAQEIATLNTERLPVEAAHRAPSGTHMCVRHSIFQTLNAKHG